MKTRKVIKRKKQYVKYKQASIAWCLLDSEQRINDTVKEAAEKCLIAYLRVKEPSLEEKIKAL
jgi:hypothetical protein